MVREGEARSVERDRADLIIIGATARGRGGARARVFKQAGRRGLGDVGAA